MRLSPKKFLALGLGFVLIGCGLVKVQTTGGMGMTSGSGSTASGSDDDAERLCTPSCYAREPASASAGQVQRACGYASVMPAQDATPAGWGPVYLRKVRPLLVPTECEFPNPEGPYAELAGQVKRVLAGGMSDGDVVYVDPEMQWEPSDTQHNGTIIQGRILLARWYQKNLELTTTACGTADMRVSCEANGSSAALVINLAHYRVDEAKAQADKGDTSGCKAAAEHAFRVAQGGVDNPDYMVRNEPFGVIYHTRFDGKLTHGELIRKLREFSAQARERYRACGGQDELKQVRHLMQELPPAPSSQP